jgi:ABC-type phosphate/phosphonate transport system substrate-binding protein
MNRHRLCLIPAFLLLAFAATPASAEIRLGVVAPRGELEALTRWSEFGKYLARELGQPVSVQPLNAQKVVPGARAGSVDFVLSHAAHAAVIQEKLGGTPLVTLNSESGTQFAGVIVARKDSGITRAEQLKGKNVLALDKVSAGAHVFQVYYLMQKGMDPYRDLASIREGKKQDDLVLAVDAGLGDAAFIRTGVLEQMAREGKIRLGNFTVVDQQRDSGFPLLHTTPLYPEWYIVSTAQTAPEIAAAVKTAALKLDAGNPAARSAQIRGFVEPIALDSMKDALRALKLPPYEP